jgi:cytochrome c-type biogenesis protein CcmH/NrfG
MAKIALRAYNHEIEGMIEGGQLTEAVAHCQHILKTFSMHIETYRLLGKAYLESRRYADAADIFQRTLMSVPDDFVAHVGMSIIRDDENKLDDAIWHMERAFEVQPSNPAIQGELRRLYGRRDGVEPPKIRLSRDALANMYSQGELFNQAIAEIRAVLAEDANRPDLQVMLARAYYRGGHKVEAAEMAAGLLKKYAYCLDALRILVEVLPSTGKGENTQVYRQRLRMLDPYTSFTKESVFQSDQVADVAVNLERLEYRTDSPGTSAQPNWASSLGIKLDGEKGTGPEPEWMAGGQSAEPLVTFEPIPATQSNPEPPPAPLEPEPLQEQLAGSEAPLPAAAPAEGQGSIPDWMRSAGWQESAGTLEEAPAESGGVAPAEPIAAAEIPDWLKSMAPPGVTGGAAPVSEDAVPVFPIEPAAAELPGADIPDWLKKPPEAPLSPSAADDEKKPPASFEPSQLEETIAASAPPPPPSANPFAGTEQPSPKDNDAALAWLGGLAAKQGAKEEDSKPPAPSPAVAETALPAQDFDSEVPTVTGPVKPLSIEDDAMAWLESLAAKRGAKPEELLTKPEDRSETLSEWIRKAALEQQSAPGTVPAAPQEVAPKPPAQTVEFIPSTPFQAGATPTAPAEPTETIPEPAVPKGEDLTITSWLNKLDVEDAVGKARASKPAVPSSDADLPDWLKGLNKPSPGGETLKPDEGMPDWMGGAAAPAAESTPSPAPLEPPTGKEAPNWVDDNAPVVKSPPTSPEEWVPVEKGVGPATDTQPVMVTPAADKTPAPPAGGQLRGTGGLSKVPAQDKDAEMLSAAQSSLEGDKLKEAMQSYAKLIKKGRLLDEVVHDLREAIYRYPVDIIVWQTLGDAYMRANRLQDALDAYSKAEELLR